MNSDAGQIKVSFTWSNNEYTTAFRKGLMFWASTFFSEFTGLIGFVWGFFNILVVLLGSIAYGLNALILFFLSIGVVMLLVTRQWPEKYKRAEKNIDTVWEIDTERLIEHLPHKEPKVLYWPEEQYAVDVEKDTLPRCRIVRETDKGFLLWAGNEFFIGNLYWIPLKAFQSQEDIEWFREAAKLFSNFKA